MTVRACYQEVYFSLKVENSGTYHSKVIFFHASRASKSKAGLRSRTPFHFSLQAP